MQLFGGKKKKQLAITVILSMLSFIFLAFKRAFTCLERNNKMTGIYNSKLILKSTLEKESFHISQFFPKNLVPKLSFCTCYTVELIE